ncbi:MAG: hypothetical protein KJ709_03385 [Nanoarchaeota archaeon]|nr:hypothetical protein [Nanoarchaeota archaeon]
MVTVSHLTKKLLQEKPFVHEALEKGLVNIGALAEFLKPDIEKDLGKVKTSAISMAIRRYVEGSAREMYHKVKLTRKTDLVVKSNLFEISLPKTRTVYRKLVQLYEIVDFSTGDTLNIIHGNYEILIISNERYLKRFLQALKGERVKRVGRNMASISIKIPTECIPVPGFYFAITKALTIENITIFDIVNTETEATLILKDKDISRAYDTLKREISVEYFRK